MTAQLWGVIVLFGVVAAPLPMLLHILAAPKLQSPLFASLGETMLGLLVLWCAVQSVVVALLGWTGYLSLSGILLLEGALLVWGLWLISREDGLPVRRLCHHLRGGMAALAERPPAERWLLALVCGVVLLLLVRMIMRPVTDWDSLFYHLPRVADWYQLGTFVTPGTRWEGMHINFSPYNWHTLLFLALVPVAHDQFVLLMSLLAWLILGLATYALARLVGGDRFGPIVAAVLLLFLPLSIGGVYTARNDLPLGAVFVAAVYFTMDGWRHKRGYSYLMALISVAVMAGTKMSGVTYAGLIAALSLSLFAFGRLRSRPRPLWVTTVREQPLLTGLAVASIGLLGVSWYVHNALVTGNPLGFVQISVFGRVLLHGEVTRDFINRTNLLYNFSVTNPHHWQIALRAGVELLGLPGLVLVVLALAAPYSILRRPRVRGPLLILVCVCLASLYLYVSGPWSAKYANEADISDWTGRQMRYSFPFLGLLAATAGAAVRIPPSGLAASSVILLATLEAITIASEGKLGYSPLGLIAALAAVLVFLGFRVGICQHLNGTFSRLVRRPTAKLAVISGIAGIMAALVVLTGFGTAALLKVRYKHQDAFLGGISRFIDDLPPGTRVGFWATDISYLLYGKRFQHSPRYLPLNAQGSSDGMLRYLRAQPVDVIALGPRTKFNESSPVWTWMAEKGRQFERLHGKDARDDIMVYRLRRSGQ